MSVKDILVQADMTPASDARVALAVRLARRFRARLVGLCVLPSFHFLAPPEDGTTIAEIVADIAILKQQAATAGEAFRQRLDNEGLPGDWHVVAENPLDHLEQQARISDLVVLGQYDPDEPAGLEDPEAVILSCGRPALVVPYAGEFDHVGSNVLIGWNGSREATRAAHDALPLIAEAQTVKVLSVEGENGAIRFGSELADHLQQHGLNAAAETGVCGELSVADAILSNAADSGSDMIVMGAYGHSRLRERILGGVTRDILRSMTVPVLMAH